LRVNQSVCVSNKILLSKLFYYDIHGVNALWFESCLVNRRQKAEITIQNEKEKLSQNCDTIKSGIPQRPETNLGTFIIYNVTY
jgi:hypothetical protein